MGVRTGKPKGRPPGSGADVPQLLKDMRWVARNKAVRDQTEGQRVQREAFETDRDSFHKRMQELEKLVLMRSGKVAVPAAIVPSVAPVVGPPKPEVSLKDVATRDFMGELMEEFNAKPR